MKIYKKPWPTKDVMEQIYRNKLWGDNGSKFYSGKGSHHPELINPYVEVVTEFLKSFGEPITVCDLGCGDFNVGKQLVPHVKNYVAVDVVHELITFNAKQFQYPNLEFQCLDIVEDNLPKGDCVILRQVLQHLSNKEITAIVSKLPQYKYLILTEHVPEGDFTPNLNIISSQGIRLKKESGVDLLAPPFNLRIKEERQLLSQTVQGYKGIIVTTLYTL